MSRRRPPTLPLRAAGTYRTSIWSAANPTIDIKKLLSGGYKNF